jgi:hypothetical protein
MQEPSPPVVPLPEQWPCGPQTGHREQDGPQKPAVQLLQTPAGPYPARQALQVEPDQPGLQRQRPEPPPEPEPSQVPWGPQEGQAAQEGPQLPAWHESQLPVCPRA